jgi:hypothetical protein
MLDFKKLAQKATTLADIMVGKDKLDMEELIDTYPDGVTITDYEYFNLKSDGGKEEEVIAFTIAEEEDMFIFGGIIVKNMFKDMYKRAVKEGYEGTDVDFHNDFVDSVSKGLELKIRFYRDKTKDKKAITKLEILK